MTLGTPKDIAAAKTYLRFPDEDPKIGTNKVGELNTIVDATKDLESEFSKAGIKVKAGDEPQLSRFYTQLVNQLVPVVS